MKRSPLTFDRPQCSLFCTDFPGICKWTCFNQTCLLLSLFSITIEVAVTVLSVAECCWLRLLRSSFCLLSISGVRSRLRSAGEVIVEWIWKLHVWGWLRSEYLHVDPIQERQLYTGLISPIIFVWHSWKKWVLASPDGSKPHSVALESEVYCDMLNRQMGFALRMESWLCLLVRRLL